MVPEYERVKALIKYLQAMRGRPLWKHEDASLQVLSPELNVLLASCVS